MNQRQPTVYTDFIKKRYAMVETPDFLKMLSRIIRAAGRRVAESDEYELTILVELRNEFDQAIEKAIEGQRASGRSWAHIGLALGTTRQAAFKHYGRKINHEQN